MNTSLFRGLFILCLLFPGVRTIDAASTIYTEIDDAGELLNTAPTVPGGINQINGAVAFYADVDLYKLSFDVTANVSVNISVSSSSWFDVDVTIFNQYGNPLIVQDPASFVWSVTPGTYYFAIADWNIAAVNSAGDIIADDYYNILIPTEVLAGWRVTSSPYRTGPYEITFSVSTAPESSPPVADADGPYTIYEGDMLTLDANSSTDEDNDIVSYLWDLDDDNIFETDAGNQSIIDVDFAYLQSLGLDVDNTYTINLKVTDSEDQSDINDTTLTILPVPALQVYVDIDPRKCPNIVNARSNAVLFVAILGTDEFDVSEIDPASIRLAGVEPFRTAHKDKDVAAPKSDTEECACTTAGRDGFPDLTLKFKTKDIVNAIGDVDNGEVLILGLTGLLYDSTPFEGEDCILIHSFKDKPEKQRKEKK